MKLFLITWLTLLNLVLPAQAADTLLEPWQHASEIARSGPLDSDYLLGLGAMQKIGGRWRLKASEPLRGELTRVTWKVADGFTAEEAWEWYVARLPQMAKLVFSCQGRDCGSSAQWADRIFQEKLLYGHDERQRYGVWRLGEVGATVDVVVYAVDRANRRHYLHVDLLRRLSND